MKRAPTIAFVMILTLVAAACGGDDSSGNSSGSGSASASATAGADAGPVTVEHRFGTTEIDGTPERIVALDTQWTDVLLALGTTPVGYLGDPNVEGDLPWRDDRLADSTKIEAVDSLPYEQIASLRPDLIVVTYYAEEASDYETLSGIAPTIAGLTDAVDPWQDIALVAGEVLGATDEAQAIVDEVDEAVAAVREELPGIEGKTFALVNYVPGDAFYVVSDPQDGANVLFAQLGLEITPTILDVANTDTGRVELSLEQSSLLDGDVLILLTNGAETSEIAGYDQLPAVRSGAVAVLGYADIVGLNTPTPLSVPYSLELIRPALDAAAT